MGEFWQNWPGFLTPFFDQKIDFFDFFQKIGGGPKMVKNGQKRGGSDAPPCFLQFFKGFGARFFAPPPVCTPPSPRGGPNLGQFWGVKNGGVYYIYYLTPVCQYIWEFKKWGKHGRILTFWTGVFDPFFGSKNRLFWHFWSKQLVYQKTPKKRAIRDWRLLGRVWKRVFRLFWLFL